MKPSSLIYLVFAVAIIFVGLFICSAASAAASASGSELFNSKQNDEGDLVFTYDFSADNVKRLSIETLGADVMIEKTSGNSYIELVNFADGSYTFSHTNRIVSVTNNTNLSSILQFGTNGFHFDGLRHYLRGTVDTAKPKSVRVYVGPDSVLQSVDVSLQSGDFSIRNISVQCDYKISVTDGETSVFSLYNAGSLKFDGNNSDLEIKNADCDIFSGSLHNGSITADNFRVSSSLFANTDAGSIKLSLLIPITEFRSSINSVKGNVSINGNVYENGYNDAVDSNDRYNFEIKVNTGDIVLTTK